MKTAFVETTVLTNYLLKRDGSEIAAKNLMSQFDVCIVPEFSWKEFKRGPLSAFRWAHDKLASTGSYAQTLQAFQRLSMTPKRYFIATAAQALHTGSVSFGSMTTADLQVKYGKAATLDNVQADANRLELKALIVSSWNKRHKLGCDMPLSCYKNIDVMLKNNRIDMDPLDCKVEDCCLRSKLISAPEKLRKLSEGLRHCPEKKETQVRARVVNDLIRTPNRDMSPKLCRAFGDAFFVSFCPPGATILTTNSSDITPLASQFGVPVRTP
jgi:hypothetical protein